jgi:hypothetical protein
MKMRTNAPLLETDPLAGLPEDAADRIRRFCAAASVAKEMGGEADFRACVLMSLAIYSDDAVLDEAINDAFETIRSVVGRTQ